MSAEKGLCPQTGITGRMPRTITHRLYVHPGNLQKSRTEIRELPSKRRHLTREINELGQTWGWTYMPTNPVETDWLHTLANELQSNFLMDTAKGKTAYACGIAYALQRLEQHCSRAEWERLRDDASEFCEAYMAGQ